jgi:hypothetical protein
MRRSLTLRGFSPPSVATRLSPSEIHGFPSSRNPEVGFRLDYLLSANTFRDLAKIVQCLLPVKN